MPKFRALLVAYALFLCLFAGAAEPDRSRDPATADESPVADQLQTIQRDIAWLRQALAERRKDLAAAGPQDAADVKSDIADLEGRLEKAKLNFIATVSEVELPPVEPKDKTKKRDLLQEAQQFIEPVFDALHRVSAKPRRIEGYRTQIFNLKTRLSQVDLALANLDHVIKAGTYPAFQAQIADSSQSLAHERDDLQIQIDTYQRKLSQELADHRSVMQLMSEDIQDFISSKGRNLLIAFIVFVAAFSALTQLRKLVFRARSIRRSPQLAKTLAAIYVPIAAFGALLAVLITLHFLNDWFLVTIITLGFLSVLWALKAFMPVFINEMKLVLNLGPVKQGERVVWAGVPWFVKSLGLRSVLVNEALRGGEIALPASALVGLISRTLVESEPWFPTLTGDYVLLDDGVYGAVETQTPEMVVLNCDGARKHYSTTGFLAKNPQNFSRGFEIAADFVVRHRSEAKPKTIESLRPALEKAVAAKLAARLASSGAKDGALTGLRSGLAASGAVSTRVWLKADCPGSLAGERDAIRRELLAAGSEAWRELGVD